MGNLGASLGEVMVTANAAALAGGSYFHFLPCQHHQWEEATAEGEESGHLHMRLVDTPLLVERAHLRLPLT